MSKNSTPITDFDQFNFVEYFNEIVFYLRRMGIEVADAEDLTQQLFLNFKIRVLKDPQFVDRLNHKGVWYASAKNLAIDYFKKRNVYKKVLHEFTKQSGGMDVFEWHKERNEQHFDLLNEIKALPPVQRSILEKVLANKSNAEIAESLRISYTALTTAKSKGLKKLAEKLHLSLLLNHVWEILFTLFLSLWGLIKHYLERH